MNNKKILLEPAFVLHSRCYRETSVLLTLFTQHEGRVDLVAKGVRQAKSKTSGLLQPFFPLLISFAGKTELMTLTQVEPHGALSMLQGHHLFAGFYLNELLIYFLQKHDPHPILFKHYQEAIKVLSKHGEIEPILRQFEKNLLAEIGYGILPDASAAEKLFNTQDHYCFLKETDWVRADSLPGCHQAATFIGEHLHNMANNFWPPRYFA